MAEAAKFIGKIHMIPSLHHRRGVSISPNCNNNCSSFSSKSSFHGQRISHLQAAPRRPNRASTAQVMSLLSGKAQKWWEKGTQSNMKEVRSAQQLVDSLLNAGDKLVVVDFFSPSCGGCKALHPKICQLAEMNPDVEFLQVNYEEHKSMCYSLNVHVLPFFRFYRGAHGRLCSFSCTNATIKKFKNALARHSSDRCSLGPPRGLDEKELLALSANKDLSFNYTPKLTPSEYERIPSQEKERVTAETALSSSNLKPPHLSTNLISITQDSQEKDLVVTGR